MCLVGDSSKLSDFLTKWQSHRCSSNGAAKTRTNGETFENFAPGLPALARKERSSQKNSQTLRGLDHDPW